MIIMRTIIEITVILQQRRSHTGLLQTQIPEDALVPANLNSGTNLAPRGKLVFTTGILGSHCTVLYRTALTWLLIQCYNVTVLPGTSNVSHLLFFSFLHQLLLGSNNLALTEFASLNSLTSLLSPLLLSFLYTQVSSLSLPSRLSQDCPHTLAC